MKTLPEETINLCRPESPVIDIEALPVCWNQFSQMVSDDAVNGGKYFHEWSAEIRSAFIGLREFTRSELAEIVGWNVVEAIEKERGEYLQDRM